MEYLNFTDLDNILVEYPKEINNLIFEYYSLECRTCNKDQIYCYTCELYNCNCTKTIRFCNVRECNKLLCCTTGTRIHPTEDDDYRQLCHRCWNIDIHIDILEDINRELNDPQSSWWCMHGDDFHIEPEARA